MRIRKNASTPAATIEEPIEAPKVVTPRRKVVARAVSIQITQESIDDAKRGDSGHCMIADAIKNQIPGASSVFVDLQTIRWSDHKKGVRFVYLTPRIGQLALVGWDAGVDPKPFDLRLTAHMAQVVRMKRVMAKGSDTREPRGKRTIVREHNGVTQVDGGETPPTAALPSGKGARREFGIAGLTK